MESSQNEVARFDWQQVGKRVLGGLAIAGALAVPVAARAVEAVADMPPTHVPMTVGGAQVDAQLEAGQDVIKLDVLGHAFVHPSDLKIGRKHYGVTVDFRTETTATSLLNKNGTPDDKKITSLFSKFSDVTPQMHEIQDALSSDIRRHARNAAEETLAIEAGLLGLYALQRHRRRNYSEEQRGFIANDRRPTAIAAGLAVGIAAITPVVQAGQYYWAPNHHQSVQADPAFKHTELQGWAVYGPLAGLIDVGIHTWNHTAETKNKFYDAEQVSFTEAFAAKYGEAGLPRPPHTKRILFLDDLQGMDGPTKIVGAAAKAYGVDVIAIGGDTEDTDIPYISVLDGLHEHAKGFPVVLGTGEHDPANMAKLVREHGFVIGDGTIQKVGGVPFRAAADASTTSIFSNTVQLKQGFNDRDLTNSLIQQTCSSTKSVIVLVHDHRIGESIAETGCAADVLMGRSYFPPSPTDYGRTVAITSGSTGGHGFNEGINVTGIIANPGPFQIIDVDETSLEFVQSVIVTMDPIPTSGGDTSTPSTTVMIGEPITRLQLLKAKTYTLAPNVTLAAGKH